MSTIDFSSLNAFDYIVFTIIGLSTLFAFFRGFIHTVLSFIAWIGSIFIAIYMFPLIQPLVADHVGNEIVANIIAFMGIYLVSLIIIIIVNYQILSLVSLLRLGAIDKSLGFAFGLARGIVLVTIIFMTITFFVALFGMREGDDETAKAQLPEWLTDAQSFDMLRLSSATMLNLIPKDFWKEAKDYTQILNKPLQPKSWRPEMDKAVTSVVNELPEGVRLDILDKYKVQDWSDLPPKQRRNIANEVVNSYKRLVSAGEIKDGQQISEDSLIYLEKILKEAQPTEAELRKLKAMFGESAYNGGKVIEDIKE